MEYHQRIEKIENQIDNFQLQDAEALINKGLQNHPDDLELLYFRGKLAAKRQQYGDALNAYKYMLSIDADNEKAHAAIKMIDNILEIRRTFYFENTYTDDELYE